MVEEVMPPRFSVIIPTRNREHFLREAVASVLIQSVKDLELLIVNDGLNLNTRFDDAHIRVIDNHQAGHVPARNMGLANAQGEYIAFLDDDDQWIDPTHLARALERLSTNADLTFADGIMPFPGEGRPRTFAFDATPRSLEENNTILISAVCYRRDLHVALGNFDEALPYYWDWDWYLRVARGNFTILHDANKAVSIRIHANNMSGGSNVDERTLNLARFAAKHGIGPLVLKNHADFTSN
jgi:glycosyltransferase involved in cell wall biosynthesis